MSAAYCSIQISFKRASTNIFDWSLKLWMCFSLFLIELICLSIGVASGIIEEVNLTQLGGGPCLLDPSRIDHKENWNNCRTQNF